jgi:prepilin-type N-terminal cleavage/methylation domain-containing protein
VTRTNHGGEKGFSIIELMIVMAIIGILVTIAIFTYMSTIDRIKLQGDVRELNGALQLARMRAISSGIPHGVAFWRSSDPTQRPDAYFIFVDCNRDSIYTDNDSNPANNTPIDNWSLCNKTLGYDPIYGAEKTHLLSNSVYFAYIFGSSSASSAQSGAPLEYVAFNSLGQAMWGSSLVGDESPIYLQNHRTGGKGPADRSGVKIWGATGNTDLIPMGRGKAFP